jgi:presenilin-like A22 family membrane protease
MPATKVNGIKIVAITVKTFMTSFMRLLTLEYILSYLEKIIAFTGSIIVCIVIIKKEIRKEKRS